MRNFNYITCDYSNNIFRLIIWIILYCFSITTIGCYTTKIENVREEGIDEENSTEISSVLLKNGKYISLKDKEPRFERLFDGKSNVIVYSSKDTIISSDKTMKITDIENTIEIKDIASAKIQASKLNTALTIILVGTTVLVAGIVLYILIAMNNAKGKVGD